MSLLDDIRKAVDSGLKQAKLYRTATLTKYAPGPRAGGSLSAGTNPVATTYPCRGLISGYDAMEVALSNTLINSDDRKITIFGGSLPTGVIVDKNDRITIQDAGGAVKTFRVLTSPNVDEAGGAFICQGRG